MFGPPLRRYFAQAAQRTLPSAQISRYPYFIPRNTRGSLPVYTDIRNGGTRYLVLIRNVDGNTNILAKDLANTLFRQNTPEASRLKIESIRSKNLVISGGRWKINVIEWLKERGF
ncbi:hypothetical protein L208DRAFT_1289038 [Tricholoma matsutake]|nr:hypothetical protein L208DRAFT_1289038 [Tricholoma matsutake 945]